jgi:histidine ammonia-lyase
LQIIDNLEKIEGIELFCAAQGFDFRKPLKSGPLLDICHDKIRLGIPHIDRDVYLGDYINTAILMVKEHMLTDLTTSVALEMKIDFKNNLHELFGIY